LKALLSSVPKTAAVSIVNDNPSYLVGPYDYSNTSAADHIELSGNITTEYFGNSTFIDITGAAPAGSATATTTLIDATGNSNGTLNGFALTGNTSNWTNGIASGNMYNFCSANYTGNRYACCVCGFNHCISKCNNRWRMEQQ
jgi:hypothetical protein